jgi:signal transduction histidine kinase
MARSGGSLGVKIAMVAAVSAVFALAYLDLRREQARALDDFTAEQAALARSSAATLEARIGAVLQTLAQARTLALSNDFALLQTLVAAPVRQIVTLDGSRLSFRIPEQPAPTGPLATALKQAAAAVGRTQAQWVSAPIEGPDRSRLRVFAARDVALIVDTNRFFDGMTAGDAAPMRWLVVDDAGRALESGPDADSAWRAVDGQPGGQVAELIDRMRAGADGTIFLGRPAADALGLGKRSAVAGFAKVAAVGERPWSLAVVTSARRVRDRAQLAAWRLGAATALTALLVALFGVMVRRQRDREQLLAEALRQVEATAAQRARAEQIVESMPLGVAALDGELRVTSANPFLTERGVRAGGRLAEALPRASADEIAELEALVAQARGDRRPVERLGLKLRLAGNDQREVDAYAIPLSHPLPGIDAFLVLHDRTDVHALERNLIRAEKLATIGTLAAGVAHEIGTPLGIISGRAEQLLGKGDESTQKALSSILAQVDKVSATIRQLLDFARARPIEADAVTPAQALSSAAALLEHRFRHAKVALAVDAPPSVPAVKADPGQLEQVLVNLLINACDACGEGGHVTARAEGLDGNVALDVIDDGCGIAPEHLSAVLDPFFTTKKRGQGTGLGLTIAADIVRNHGGTLEIESAIGRGTTVRVKLPRAVGLA